MREVYGGARIVTFVTRDLARAREFYVDRLGLAVVGEEPGRFVMVNAGNFRLCIDAADDAHPPRGGGASIQLRVRHLGRTPSAHEERGVAYECHTGQRVGDYLEAHDPDGYRIVFVERV